MKAILEFEAPESCAKCRLLATFYMPYRKDARRICMGSTNYYNEVDVCKDSRAPLCPLQIINNDRKEEK